MFLKIRLNVAHALSRSKARHRNEIRVRTRVHNNTRSCRARSSRLNAEYVRVCVRTVGSSYSQYDGTSSGGSETVPLNPTPARGAASFKLPEHQTLLDIDNPEQNANSFGKPFESSVSTTRMIYGRSVRVI